METPTLFGSRLKQLREEKNLTQEQLGKELNITKHTISKYENNVREPEYYHLIKIASFLQVSIDYLLGKTDQR